MWVDFMVTFTITIHPDMSGSRRWVRRARWWEAAMTLLAAAMSWNSSLSWAAGAHRSHVGEALIKNVIWYNWPKCEWVRSGVPKPKKVAVYYGIFGIFFTFLPNNFQTFINYCFMAYEVPFTLKVETPPFKTELISNEIIPRLEYEYIAKGFIFRKGRIKVTVSRVGIVKLPLKNLNFQLYMVYT